MLQRVIEVSLELSIEMIALHDNYELTSLKYDIFCNDYDALVSRINYIQHRE